MRLALLVLLAGCPKSTPAPVAAEPVPPEVVPEFRFDWPDGLAGERAAVKITTRKVGAQELRQEIRTTEQQRVEKTETGWIVHSVEGRFERADGAPIDPAIEALALVPLALEVKADGRFGGLVDASAWADAARAAMLATAEEGDVLAQVTADAAVQPRALERVLAEDWYARVDFWLGKPSSPGGSGTVPGTSPLGDAVPNSTAWKVTGPVACHESQRTFDCVLAKAEVKRSDEDLQGEAGPLLDAWLKAQEAAPESAAIDWVRGQLKVEIVVAPDTLVVHRYSRSRTLESAATVDGAEVPLASTLKKSVTWNWTVPGGAE